MQDNGQAQYHQEHISRHLVILILECGGSYVETERRRVVFCVYSGEMSFMQETIPVRIRIGDSLIS